MMSATTEIAPGYWRPPSRLAAPAAMAFPAVGFLVVFLVIPALTLLSYSVLVQSPTGEIGLPLTLNNFQRLLGSPTYRGILFNTVFIAGCSTVFAILLAYPLAMTVAYGRPLLSRLTMVAVVAPLVVSVIVRSYGWQLLLGNGPAGVVNFVLSSVGLPPFVKILNSKWAVVVASVHVYLPLLVLPLAASLGRIPPNLIEAARMLGAPSWRAFFGITLPLSYPGLLAGATVVFTLTAGSFITPQMLGGTDGMVLGVLLEQQVNTVYDWPMSAAIATLMVAIALTVHFITHRVMNARPTR